MKKLSERIEMYFNENEICNFGAEYVSFMEEIFCSRYVAQIEHTLDFIMSNVFDSDQQERLLNALNCEVMKSIDNEPIGVEKAFTYVFGEPLPD